MIIRSDLFARSLRGLAAIAAILALAVGSAGAAPGAADFESVGDGFLGVYGDAQATQRCVNIAPGTFTTLYVVATLGGDTGAGITGAEFRIEVSNPSGWFFQYTPPNVPVVIGQPLDLTPNDPNDRVGMNIAFSSCQTGPLVQMGTLSVINLSGGPTQLSIKRKNLPPNADWACPLFTVCDAPAFSKVCMRACSFDALGGTIAATMSINDPACLPAEACATDCPGGPCVTIGPLPGRPVCEGEPTDVVATAINCSDAPEDIDVFVDYQLVGSFTAVAPGQTVTVRQPVPPVECTDADPQPRHNVSAVARNSTCPERTGAERQQVFFCDPRRCGGNVPPDCSNARPSVSTLWPPNGQLVPVTIEGIVDPNGDPVDVRITNVSSDEDPGRYRQAHCPDAVRNGPTVIQLRAERDGGGNGRVYTVGFEARDASTLRCGGEVKVYVPPKPNSTAIEDPVQYDPEWCTSVGIGVPRSGVPVSAVPMTGGVEVSFVLENAGTAEVEVFDIRGRRVTVLTRATFAAGSHALQWDGRNQEGRPAASGVYLFRARLDGGTYTLKSVLMR